MRWIVVLALVACNRDPSPTPSPNPNPNPSPSPSPSPSPNPNPRPSITIDELAPLLPPLDGDAILPLQPTVDHHQLHATWCVAGTGADTVAKHIGDALTAGTWIDTSLRGDAIKAAVSADRDRYRASVRAVTASSMPSCAAPTSLLRIKLTAFRVR